MNYLIVSIEKLISVLLSAILIILLPNYLEPYDFAIIAYCAIVVTISMVLIDSGAGGALIKIKNTNYSDFSTVFSINVIIAIFLYIFFYVSSETFSAYTEIPELKNAIRLISLMLLFESISLTYKVNLTKKLKFKLQSTIIVITLLINVCSTMVFAINDYNYNSYVYGQLLSSLSSMFLFFIFSEKRYAFFIRRKSFNKIYKIGMLFTVSSLTRALNNSLLTIIIGASSSKEQLGFYNRANTINEIVRKNIISILDRVTFAQLSVVKRGDFSLKVRKNLQVVVYFSFLLITLVIVCAENVVDLIYDKKWSLVGSYLYYLGFSSFGFVIVAVNRNILKSNGNIREVIINEIFFLIGLIIIAPILHFFDIYAFLISLIGLSFVLSILSIITIKMKCNINITDFFKIVIPILVISLISIFLNYIYFKNTMHNIIDLIQIILFDVIIYCLLSSKIVYSFMFSNRQQ